MSADFRLLMIGAMYENGGNVTHRLFDGHPQLFVYPFESQLGTRLVVDRLASLFPVKYRWPVFALDAAPEEDYRSIIDEECRVRARTPHVSKFRDHPFEFSDDERMRIYLELVRENPRSRAGNVAAFFRATFDAWRNCRRTGEEVVHVGYSPVVVVDADRILDELPCAHFLHVVRNPWSAYADTKKRPVPLSLPDYLLAWTLNQHYALLFERKYPERFHILRAEDIMSDPRETLGRICRLLGVEVAESLAFPSWNGRPLAEVYPWGTIRQVTPAANRAAADELTRVEREEIRVRSWQYLEPLDYLDFLARPATPGS